MFRKLVIFVAINAVIAALVAMAPPSLVNPVYSGVALVFDYVDGVKKGDELNVILGDSRSECCVGAEALGFVNLSYAGSTPVEGYYLLRELLDRGAKIDKLIVSYGPFHIFTQDSFHAWTRYFGLVDPDFTSEVMQQAAALDDKEYLEYQWRALEVIDGSVPWLPDQWKFRVVNVLSMNEVLHAGLKYGAVAFSEEAAAKEQQEAMKLYVTTAQERVNDRTESPEFGRPSARSPVNELYLKKLLDLAREHGIELSFLVMPFNRDVSQPEHEYYKRYYTILKNDGLEGCVNKPIWWPNEDFADTHHLNAAGAEKFNEGLNERLSYCR